MKLPRILVVDDQPHIARVTGMILDEAGKYDIALETRPAHVLSMVRLFSPDTIVLDCNMPGKNGVEIAREIWDDETLRETGILFFSGLAPEHDLSLRKMARGPYRFISKMAPSHELRAAVAEMLLPFSKAEDSAAA